MAKNKPVPDPAKVAQRKAERVAFVQSKPNLSPEQAREQFYVQTRAAELTAAGKAVDKKALRQKFETGGVTREGFYTAGDKARIASQQAPSNLADSKSAVVAPTATPGTPKAQPTVSTTTPSAPTVKPPKQSTGGDQPVRAGVGPKAKAVPKPGGLAGTLGINPELAKKTVGQIKQHGYDATIGAIKPLAGLVNAPINAIGEGLNWLSGNGPDAGYNPHLYDPGLKENLKTAALIVATEGLFGAGGGANAIANRISSAKTSVTARVTGSEVFTAAENLAYKSQGLPTPIKGLKPTPEAPVYGPPKPVGGLRAESLAEAKVTAAPKAPAVGGLVDETTTASGIKIPSSKTRTKTVAPTVEAAPTVKPVTKTPATKNERFVDAWDDTPVDMSTASGFDDMNLRATVEPAIEAPKTPKPVKPKAPAIEVKATPAKPVVEIKTTKPPAPPTISSAANLAEVKGAQPYTPQNPPRAWDPKNPWEHDPLSGSMTGGVEGFDPSMPRVNRGPKQQAHDTLVNTMRDLINSETTGKPLQSSFGDQVDAAIGQANKSMSLNALSKAESEAAITTANKNFEAAAPKNAANVKTVKLTPEEMEARFAKKPKLANWEKEKDKIPNLRKPPKPGKK